MSLARIKATTLTVLLHCIPLTHVCHIDNVPIYSQDMREEKYICLFGDQICNFPITDPQRLGRKHRTCVTCRDAVRVDGCVCALPAGQNITRSARAETTADERG